MPRFRWRIAIGALVGLVQRRCSSTGLRIPSFIVTLGSYNLLYGLSLWITKASTFNPVYPPQGSEIPDAQLDFFTGLTAVSDPIPFRWRSSGCSGWRWWSASCCIARCSASG